MRKQTKLVAVLSAAALFTIGASMTSFAGTAHWEQEGEDWVYLDKDGDKVTDTWKKSGSNWFYLDSDGYMAKDTIVISGANDDKYYVDSNGAKVTNTWVSVDNEGDNECSDQDDITTVWYYFGSNGKAHKGDGKKVVKTCKYGENMNKSGTFAFDEEGHMLSGWQDIELSNDTYRYYFGDENEGWARLGWQYLEKPEDASFDEDRPYENEAWFYFGTNGRAAQDTTKYINGQYYTFDTTGAMKDEWRMGTPGVSESTVETATDAHAYYTDSIGHRRTGWLYTWAPDDPDHEEEENWYYLSNKGEAFNDDAKDTVRSEYNKETEETVKTPYEANAVNMFDDTDVELDVAAKVIKNKTFLFDGEGKMITGVRKLTGDTNRVGGKVLVEGIYYFNTEEGSQEGAMITGKTSVEDEGDKYYYYFKKDGSAYTDAMVKGSIYGHDGKRIEAEYGSKYEPIVLDYDVVDGDKKDEAGNPVVLLEAGDMIVVNGSGTVKRNASKIEIDGTNYKVEDYKVVDFGF